MMIKTLTWNIGGGKLLRKNADPTRLSSYTVDGLAAIAKKLKEENPDIITLQETQKSKERDQAQIIANDLGYFYVHDSTSVSHIDEGHQLGHAILSQFKITSHASGFFTNPHVETTWEDGSKVTSFDKGYTTCTLDVHGKPVTVTTFHLFPFRKFGVDMHSAQAANLLQDIQSKLKGHYSPWIIQGDFNINDATIREYMPAMFDGQTTEISLQSPTNIRGRKYDHIICCGGNIVNHMVISDVRTDHFPVTATITIDKPA